MSDRLSKNEVVDLLVDYIQNSEISVGQHLPSERVLAEKLSVSRGQIRTALSELRHNGMIDIIPQVGTILKSKSPCVSSFCQILNMGSIDLQSLIEVRVSLEVTAAGLAAKRATESDIQRIEKLCYAYGNTLNDNGWGDTNYKFHMEIIKSSHNSAIISIMDTLLSDAASLTWSRPWDYAPNRLKESLREHEEILNGIRRHDVKRAMDAARNHMRNMSTMVDVLTHMYD